MRRSSGSRAASGDAGAVCGTAAMIPRGLVHRAALPNLITLARLFSAPVAVWLVLVDEYAAALWLFVAAGISDAVDGILARLLDARSVLGSYLDPIADKALLTGMFFALGYKGVLPVWLVVLAVSRDLFILGGAVLLQTVKPGMAAIPPSRIGKLNTVLQIALATVALAAVAFGTGTGTITFVLTWAVAATVVGSGFGYLAEAGRRLGGDPGP